MMIRGVDRTLTCILLASLASAPALAGQARPAGARGTAMRDTTAPAASPALDDAARALSAGEPDRTLALVQEYLRTHPRSARARVLLARVYLAREDFENAYQQLRQAIAVDPRYVDAFYYLGFVSGRLAGGELQRLTEMAPNSARAEQIAAETAVAQDRRAEAERAYEAALRARPNLIDALLGLARLKRIRLACDEAIALYERAEAVRPTFDGAYGLAVCLSFEQNDERSIAQYRTALERDPRSAVAWSGLAAAELKAHRPAKAIECAERALAIEPRMGEAYYVLGRAYQITGDAARAKEAFARAEQLRVDPGVAPGSTDAPSPPAEHP